MAVASSRQGAGEVGLRLLEVALGLRQPAFGVGYLGRESILLALEQIERDRVGVMRLQQLLAFAFELPEPPMLRHALTLRAASQLRQLVPEIGS
jgi:hypothetical protein